MHSLRFSNSCLARGISLLTPPIQTPFRATPLLSTQYSQCGSSPDRHLQRDRNAAPVCLYQTHYSRNQNASKEVLQQTYQNDKETLQKELDATRLKLLASQLAYEHLALSLATLSNFGSYLRCSRPLNSSTSRCSNCEGLFNLFQQVQYTAELLRIGANHRPDHAELSRSYTDLTPSPSTSRTEDTSSTLCQKPDLKTRSTKTSIHKSEDKVPDVSEIAQLMSAAHDGNKSAQNRICLLIQTAEKIPEQERSQAEKYLLLYWKKPKQREIFVDASESGIGVVMKDRWLAWQFTANPALLPTDNGKLNTSRAELIAAEMGIRTLLAGNYRHLSITICSDNEGVVKALESRQWKTTPVLDNTVKDVFALCDQVGLRLEPKWIASKENLADKPSRGVYPSQDMAFRYRPLIPVHLSKLIQEVK